MLNTKKLMNLIAKQGWTIAELSEKADVGTVTLNRILKHKTRAQLATIGRIAEALGCEPSYLLED